MKVVRSTNQPRLGARDHAILRDLWLYRYLPSAQVTRLHFPHPQTARRRLRKLVALGVVGRFQASPLVRAGFHTWTYKLSVRGARVVAEAAGLEPSLVQPPVRGPRGARYLAHHGLVTDFRIWLREACAASEGRFGYEFIPSYEEVKDGGRRRRRIALELPGGRRLVPDGAFVLIRRDGRSALFTLEVDRGTEPLTGSHRNAITRKLTRYREAFDRSAERAYGDLFGRPFSGFRVLCLVPTERRAMRFLDVATRVNLSPLVWVATVELVREVGRLESAVWRDRPHGPRLSLIQ